RRWCLDPARGRQARHASGRIQRIQVRGWISGDEAQRRAPTSRRPREARMKVRSGRVLDHLAAEEPCLGALFTSYSFDPAFFEDHVLRAVLRLTSDPVEHAERYHHEARRAL